jgi:hypothetical protein
MSPPTPLSPYSHAAFGTPKAKPRRAAKKSAPENREIAPGKVRQRSDKIARGGSTRGKRGSAVTNITIGTPNADEQRPMFSAPPRLGTAPGASPAAPPITGAGMSPTYKTGGKVAGAYPGSSGAAVNNTLARSESTGSDIRKWTAPRKFTDRMTAGSLSGEGRLEKAAHARKKQHGQ